MSPPSEQLSLLSHKLLRHTVRGSRWSDIHVPNAGKLGCELHCKLETALYKAGTNCALGEAKEAPPYPDHRVRDSILGFSDVEWCTPWSHPRGLSSWGRGVCMSWALSGDGTGQGGGCTCSSLLLPPGQKLAGSCF